MSRNPLTPTRLAPHAGERGDLLQNFLRDGGMRTRMLW